MLYTWEHMRNLFSHLEYDVGVYDFSKPIIENTEPIGTIHTSLKTVFDGNAGPISYMLKLPRVVESPIWDHVSDVIEDGDAILRIQTHPWRYSTHFDTYDQTIHVLDGYKRWIFFRTTFSTDEDEKQFIQHVNGLDLEQLQNYLRITGIPYHVHIFGPGDQFFIPRGMYHATENVHQGLGTIFINIIHAGEDQALNERFSHLWPTVTSKCEAGVYY